MIRLEATVRTPFGVLSPSLLVVRDSAGGEWCSITLSRSTTKQDAQIVVTPSHHRATSIAAQVHGGWLQKLAGQEIYVFLRAQQEVLSLRKRTHQEVDVVHAGGLETLKWVISQSGLDLVWGDIAMRVNFDRGFGSSLGTITAPDEAAAERGVCIVALQYLWEFWNT